MRNTKHDNWKIKETLIRGILISTVGETQANEGDEQTNYWYWNGLFEKIDGYIQDGQS